MKLSFSRFARSLCRPQALLLLASLAGALPVQAAEPAGSIVMLTGRATAVGSNGVVRKLAKSDPVFAGDVLNSGLGSYVNVRFADGAFFLLRPETRFQIEDYRYQPAEAAVAPSAPAEKPRAAPGTGTATKPDSAPSVAQGLPTSSASTSRALFSLIKGGFRTVSGLISKINRDDYRVRTPVATIGVRGTEYSANLCSGACRDRDEISAELRQAGVDTSGAETVLVTTVEEGQIELQVGDKVQLQSPGVVLFSTDTGVITPVPQPPKSERLERKLDPKNCGG